MTLSLVFRVCCTKCVSQGGRVRFADGPGNEREKTGVNTADVANKNIQKRSQGGRHVLLRRPP